ncbi:HEAT repeat domain-containing protein [Granulicella arctica]|uniref:HEAT repeat domain-containing protein n=1 Tax=Granulicella arctica TaxID=940613 RepID=A0A7Y9TFN5_9BACT|nr:HEAT repeat domain-containing protein [Granulicella arctica]NYF78986.1 hypothetical protein [Granulicella arctica]
MRHLTCTFIFGTLLSASSVIIAQQPPSIVHAQLSTASASNGLEPQLERMKHTDAPTWVGYSIPVAEDFHSGSQSDHIAYLEGDHAGDSYNTIDKENTPFDHAVVLLRIASGHIENIRLENPDRQLDAGGLHFLWLNGVAPTDSIHTLQTIALKDDSNHLRDTAIFAISLHQSPETIPALISLTSPNNDLALREKAAFWLTNRHGHEGFAAIQHLARTDTDPKFREKLCFDLTLSKDSGALNELIRMAHSDTSPQVRKQAQFWMANIGGKKVAGDLRDLAENDPDNAVRKSAVFALSRLPGNEAATQLIQVASSSKEPSIRKQAVFWLGQSNDPRALDYLTKLLAQ